MRTNTVTSRGLRQILPSIVALAIIAAGLTAVEAPRASATSPATLVAWGDDTDSQGRVPQSAGPAKAIAVGREHYMTLRTDGSVVAWGFNPYGQTRVPAGLTGVIGIAAGGDTSWIANSENGHSLALRSDGTVVAWGANAHGESTVPSGLSGVVSIAAGELFSLALKSDGTVVSWGDTSVPGGLSGVVAIAAQGEQSLALKTDGTVVAWGTYGCGAAPVGMTGVTAIAVGAWVCLALKADGSVVAWGGTVPAGLSGVKAIAAGNSSFAVKNDGSVVAWDNTGYLPTEVPSGLSGVVSVVAAEDVKLALRNDGSVVTWGLTPQDVSYPVPVGFSSATAVSAGMNHSLAVTSAGTVVAWGDNTMGQSLVPAGLSGVTAVAAGRDHSLALKSNGTVVAWGNNQLGECNVPAGLTGVVAIAAGWDHSLALKSDGTVVAWGEQTYGQSTVPAGLSGVVAISAGPGHSVALKSDGTVVAWGSNSEGALNVPAGLSGVTAISAGGGHNLALKSDGTVVAWGNNLDGQTVVPAGLSNVAKISAGAWDSLVVKNDGTVVGWGYNGQGQTTAPAGLSGVTAIAAGGRHTLALGVVTPPAAGALVSLSPSRVLDTRSNGGKLAAGTTRSVQVTGVGGVPASGVSAVVLNVTVTETTAGGYLTVSPTGSTRPVVSNLNWSAGATIPNAVTVKVGTGGKVDVFQSGPGSAQVIVDVAGYFMDGAVTDPGGFNSLSPARILDTRTTGGVLAAAGSRDLQVTGAGGVPASNVSAVVLNVTVTETTAGGYLSVYPAGASKPTVSNLNWSAGVTIPNQVIVKIGDAGKISLFQSGPGTAQVIVDVAGYFLGGTATKSGMFVALSPARVLDTRSSGGAVAGGGDLKLAILGKGGLPATGVSAVVVNTTVTETTAGGYLTVYPGTSPLPTASNLNWSAGTTIPNLVTVQVGTDGSIKFHNGSPGTTQIIADTAGYYISN